MIGIDLGLATAVLALLGTLGGLICWLHKVMMRFESLEQNAEQRKEDTAMLLKGVQACLDGLQQNGANHNVTAVDKELQEYLRRSR